MEFCLSHDRSTNEKDEIVRAHMSLRKHVKSDDLELPDFIDHDCSYEALSNVRQEKFSTKWGPVGFNNRTHPLSIMVRKLSLHVGAPLIIEMS